MIGLLRDTCQLVSQWISRDLCGIRNSIECCKALIILFVYLPRNEQHLAGECSISGLRHVMEAPGVNDLIVECLAFMRRQCACDAWKAAVEDNKFCFVEALGQSMRLISLQ